MLIQGISHHPSVLERPAQESLVESLRAAVLQSPLYTPVMPRTGRPFSVRMTNMGTLGWVADRDGYRYQAMHPQTGQPWAPIPHVLLELWQKYAGYPHPPEACLVNFYQQGAKMGLHQDRDEEDFNAPVLSVSLGDTAVFRLGGTQRVGKTQTLKLSSGDVLVMGGPSRLCFHGIDRVLTGTSTLLKEGGRINLTLRRVTKP
ncbi:alpha-ketoglutarate-dependent dioxygenase AlkB family protein [Aestuariivirga litoralis]|uniref:alpha-ketoglutarate-dependent dioxygenase AlkB family protein n=1 Tax=Aestuariivirga litoralis TaxID=2650924 RepID=UPI0018C7FEB5|nr:alpha-ketoglutarate-dependent dioxygenase AlkB [Aestuariivirga litoralis]MBG1233799.1 alpha-ketoglutarate-dependent dioxygenase AlkB [Aestuariivirga litoralis]